MHRSEPQRHDHTPSRAMCLEACVLVTAYAIALRTMAPSRVIALAERPLGRPEPRGVATAARRVAGAVERAAARLPARAATCLSRACAVQLMLGRRGVSSRLRLGVRKEPHGNLRAHAWIEVDGLCIGQDAGGPEFTPLPVRLAHNV